eukprot:c20369_g1_i2 orf=757-1038(+)
MGLSCPICVFTSTMQNLPGGSLFLHANLSGFHSLYRTDKFRSYICFQFCDFGSSFFEGRHISELRRYLLSLTNAVRQGPFWEVFITFTWLNDL